MVTDLDAELNPGGVLCDVCAAADAVLAAHYPGIRARPPRWCAPCGGPQLAELVAHGQVVTVTSAGPAHDAAAARPGARAPIELGDEIGVTELPWTVHFAIEVLRHAKPGGLAFARALVDAGGAATAEHLREAIGVPALNYLTATLNAALRTVAGRSRLRHPDRHLARPLPPPEDPRRRTVHSYVLPPELVPVLDEALTELGRPPGAVRLDIEGSEPL